MLCLGIRFTVQVLCSYIMVSNLLLLWDFCVRMSVSLHLHMFHVPFLWLLSPLVRLFYSGLFVFILSYFILSLDACLFSYEREIERVWIWVGVGEDVGRVEEGKPYLEHI